MAPSTPAYASSAVVHWFRRDLRLHDNWALNAALKSAATRKARFLPVFVFDSTAHTCVNSKFNRWRFLHQSVEALRASLRKTVNAELVVLHGRACDVLPDLFKDAEGDELHFEIDPAPVGVKYDQAVIDALTKKGLEVEVKKSEGHTMYEPTKLLLASPGGVAPKTMSGFIGVMERVGNPSAPVPLVRERGLSHDVEVPSFPSLSDMGITDVEESPIFFPGGEEEALRRMEEFLSREKGRIAAKFSKPKTSPATFGQKRDTTILSPYLAHGCLSSRTLYIRVDQLERKFKPNPMIQTRLTCQLIWREHFWLLGRTVRDFENEQNELCRDIPWDRTKEGEKRFEAWRDARTGYPWIDALRTQLMKEGFVHHLGRHSLACFLTRGDLWCSWEKGARVFDEELLDYDFSLNSANWMWLSCSAFFNAYFRCYSPVAFGRKWDKKGDFIRHYLPVLKDMPEKYIYEPWTAPKATQVAGKCIIGKDYPAPIVDHSVVVKENISKMRDAFKRAAQNKQKTGDSSKKACTKTEKRSRSSANGADTKGKRRKR